jgi:hypothetical protein
MAKDSRGTRAAGGAGAAGAGENVAIPVDTAELLAAGYDKMRTPNSSELPAAAAGSARSRHSEAGAADGGAGEDGAERAEADPENANDLMHGINSFWALVFPICITMILAR